MYWVCLLEMGLGGGMDVAVGHWETYGDRIRSISGPCGRGVWPVVARLGLGCAFMELYSQRPFCSQEYLPNNGSRPIMRLIGNGCKAQRYLQRGILSVSHRCAELWVTRTYFKAFMVADGRQCDENHERQCVWRSSFARPVTERGVVSFCQICLQVSARF